MAEIQTLVKRAATVRDLVTKYIPEIKKAIPRGIDAARFARVALTMLPGNPALLECDPKTLLGGILQAAAWGLELDPVLGMAYLIPYAKKAQIIIGYQGLITLARRSGEVKNIIPQSIYAGDDWQYELGLHPKLVHRPAQQPDRGELIAVYAVATMRDGEPEFRFMWKHEVEAIRQRSRARDSGPWVTDYEAMAWKTVIRRLCKYLPRTVELAKAIEMDEKVDSGIEQDLQEALMPTIDVTVTDETKSSLDKLAGTLPATNSAKPAETPAANAGTPPADTNVPQDSDVAKAQDAKKRIAQDIDQAMGAPAAAVEPREPTKTATEAQARYDAGSSAAKEDERAEAQRTGKPRRAHEAVMPSAGDIFAPPTREREPGEEG
jgi:recombination protein RecT